MYVVFKENNCFTCSSNHNLNTPLVDMLRKTPNEQQSSSIACFLMCIYWDIWGITFRLFD